MAEETVTKGIRVLTPIGALEMVFFLTIAVILDLAGLVCFILSFFWGIGVVASQVLDLIGLIIFAPWSFLRSGKIPVTRKLLRIAKRVIPGFIGESIPFFGDIVFCWTVYVFFELASD